MKKFFLLIVCALMGISSYAQQEPNRLIVRDNMGQAHPFHVNRIDSIAFATVEGTVAADITVEDVTIKDEAKGTKDMVKLAITRTPACAARFTTTCGLYFSKIPVMIALSAMLPFTKTKEG